MDFIYKNPCLDCGIIVHDRFYLFNPLRQRSQSPIYAAIIHNTTDNWENSLLTEQQSFVSRVPRSTSQPLPGFWFGPAFIITRQYSFVWASFCRM